MALLDDLSGFEFENLMEDVFCTPGYENVRRPRKPPTPPRQAYHI